MTPPAWLKLVEYIQNCSELTVCIWLVKYIWVVAIHFFHFLSINFSFLSLESAHNFFCPGQVFIIIAVSLAFGFYELQAVCSQAQVGRRGPLYTQNLRPASFRKVNILQSIVYLFGCVTLHLFPCFVWQRGSLPGAQSVMKPAEKWSIDSLLHAPDYYCRYFLLLLKIWAISPYPFGHNSRV